MNGRVAANLIVGASGATRISGSSKGLSFPADRLRFHQLRQEFKVIIIGGNTARSEPYSQCPLPLIVLSHHPLPLRLADNLMAFAWEVDLEEAIELAHERYGDILIEAGPTLVTAAIDRGLLTELYITLSAQIGGENYIDLPTLLVNWVAISEEEVEGGRFLHYRLAPSHD